jgi:hypothetical protein
MSNHALRHTGATLAYHYTHDVRAVQDDMLGHQDRKTTARYARVVDRARTNPALKVPVDLSGVPAPGYPPGPKFSALRSGWWKIGLCWDYTSHTAWP